MSPSQAGSVSLRLPRPLARRPEPGATNRATSGAARYLARDWAPRASSPPAGRWRLCPASSAGGPGVGPQLSPQGGACGLLPRRRAQSRGRSRARRPMVPRSLRVRSAPGARGLQPLACPSPTPTPPPFSFSSLTRIVIRSRPSQACLAPKQLLQRGRLQCCYFLTAMR